MKATPRMLVLATVVVSAVFSLPRSAAAHCDTMDGPVVKAAKLALATGDVTPVLKWVRQADELQIRTAFEHTLKVRALSPEARELADNYFFETLVRVHRAGEGEPYNGLKAVGTKVEPGIALADQAVDTGSVGSLTKEVASDLAEGIRQRFIRVQEANKHSNDNVESGRQFVAAYVEFIHYIENISEALTGPASHTHSEAQVAEEHM